MSTEMVNAIAGLWKPILAVALFLAVLFFRKPVYKFLTAARAIKLKRGETEVTVEGQNADQPVVPTPKEMQIPPPPPAQDSPAKPAIDEAKSPFMDLYEALVTNRDSKAAEAAFVRLLATETDDANKAATEIMYWHMRYQYLSDSAALTKLQEFADNPKTKGDGLFWLAHCHEYSRNFAKAIEIYTQSLSADLGDLDLAQHVSAIARCHSRLGNHDSALSALIDGLKRVSLREAKARVYEAIATIHEERGEKSMRAVALQKALEYLPENADLLFNAAYAQSDAGISALCAANYSTLLRFRPKHSTAMNNLGVEFTKLALPMKAVASYSQAAELKETLAMSNLANKYIDEGFAKEASTLLTQAMAEPSPHGNVGLAWSRLGDLKDQEKKSWENILTLSATQQTFFWRFAESRYATQSASPFTGNWVAHNGSVLSMTHAGQMIAGKYETDSTGEEIQGQAMNGAATIKYKSKTRGLGLGIGPAPHYYWKDAEDGFACVDAEGNHMSLLIIEKQSSRIITFSRKKE